MIFYRKYFAVYGGCLRKHPPYTITVFEFRYRCFDLHLQFMFYVIQLDNNFGRFDFVLIDFSGITTDPAWTVRPCWKEAGGGSRAAED